MNTLLATVVIGLGATAVMDLWGLLRSILFAAKPPNYQMVGRWIGHVCVGKFRLEAVSKAEPIRAELLIGWAAHYVIGIGFAALLVGLFGSAWIREPTLIPAIAVGVATLVAPFLIMQPGMGLGIAASRTANPWTARAQSVMNHLAFGIGLYLSGWAVSHFF